MDNFGRIYGKPLVRGFDAAADKALRRVQLSVLARVRNKVIQSAFSDRAKRAFAKALTVEIGPSSLTIYSKHPGFTNMIRGRQKRQMEWLVKARAPIPIITDSGELIFRTATVKSMRDGKWVHPGKNPVDFVESAKKEAKEQIRKAMTEELRKVASSASKRKIRI